jgi:hypothetical protein
MMKATVGGAFRYTNQELYVKEGKSTDLSKLYFGRELLFA